MIYEFAKEAFGTICDDYGSCTDCPLCHETMGCLIEDILLRLEEGVC